MKINLDLPISVGDSIFFCDEQRSEAKVTEIIISYVDYPDDPDEPEIIIEWEQCPEIPPPKRDSIIIDFEELSSVSRDNTKRWKNGEVNLNQLGTEFWLTYEDMLRANKMRV